MTRAKRGLAAAVGLIVLAGVPLLARATSPSGTAAESAVAASKAFLNAALVLCAGPRASAPDGWGGLLDHAAQPGSYMPMFPNPPAGGAVYNGPPLDQC